MGVGNETGQGAAVPEFIARVGARVRGLRRECGWTVQELADAAEVSRRMLTQIELGQANPSLVTIDRIARALDTDFAALARPEPGPPQSGIEATTVWSDGHGSEAVLLGATSTEAVAELWRLTLAPGASYDALPDRAGAEEIHHVLAGALTIDTERSKVDLVAGDTTVIYSDQHYTYRNPGETETVFCRVVVGA